MAQHYTKRGGIWVPSTDEDHRASSNPHPGIVVLEGDARLTNARTPSAHAASHLPGGADALTAAAAGAIQPDDSAAEGSAASFARSDHKHSIVAAAAGAATPGDSAAEGTATSFARSDHKHSLPAFGTTAGTFCEGNDSRLGSVPAAKYYQGHSAAAITWSSTTFSAIHNVVTITDDVTSAGITRSNSTWTLTDAGVYVFDMRFGAYNTAGNDYMMLRARLSGSTIWLSPEVYSESGAARTALAQVFFVRSFSAGDAVTIEYAASATWNSFGPVVIDSETGQSASMSIFRIGT